jgi:hypothetical protein
MVLYENRVARVYESGIASAGGDDLGRYPEMAAVGGIS